MAMTMTMFFFKKPLIKRGKYRWCVVLTPFFKNIPIIYKSDRFVKSFLGGQIAVDGDNVFDFVIGNVENASHGFGLTTKNYDDLATVFDCMTSGNHIWDKSDVFNYIDRADKLVRPINYPEGTPGVGSRIIEKNGVKYGVINVLGSTFMGFSPYWEIVEAEIKRIILCNANPRSTI